MGSKKRASWSKQKSEFYAGLGDVDRRVSNGGLSGFDDICAREEARAQKSQEQKQVVKRKKTCTSKNRYSSKHEAETAAFSCAEHGTASLSVYKCPYCNGWHLTSHPWSD